MEEHDRRRDGKNVFTWQVETEMKTATVMISARHDSTGTGTWADRRVHKSSLTQVNNHTQDQINEKSMWQQILKQRMDYRCPDSLNCTVSKQTNFVVREFDCEKTGAD